MNTYTDNYSDSSRGQNIQIFEAKRSDARSIVRLASQAVYSSIHEQFKEEFSEMKARSFRKQDMLSIYTIWSNPNFQAFVAKDCRGEEQSPVFAGHCLIVFGEQHGLTGEQCARIIDISVEPEYRGLGVATRLMEQAENYVLSRGVPLMLLSVTTNNEAARHLYLQRGFFEERIQMTKKMSREEKV